MNIPDGLVDMLRYLGHAAMRFSFTPPNKLEIWFSDHMPTDEMPHLIHTILELQPYTSSVEGTRLVLQWKPE